MANDYGMKTNCDTNKSKPKVSVAVITYNQENYIGECLQSILEQVVDFDFEIIVGDDCSTDETPSIIESFTEKYPHLIRLLCQGENTGGTKNFNIGIEENIS